MIFSARKSAAPARKWQLFSTRVARETRFRSRGWKVARHGQRTYSHVFRFLPFSLFFPFSEACNVSMAPSIIRLTSTNARHSHRRSGSGPCRSSRCPSLRRARSRSNATQGDDLGFSKSKPPSGMTCTKAYELATAGDEVKRAAAGSQAHYGLRRGPKAYMEEGNAASEMLCASPKGCSATTVENSRGLMRCKNHTPARILSCSQDGSRALRCEPGAARCKQFEMSKAIQWLSQHVCRVNLSAPSSILL